ncbi:MAG: clostripain-related cysteine peptidase [Armatimonadetes bacterium]|nr:clostripain-related cysteine peptidase [Armatimonadota bacterium]
MNCRLVCALMTLPLLAVVIGGCGGGGGGSSSSTSLSPPLSDPISTREEAQQHGAWTVLVYLDADNDLETAAITNFNQMEVAGSTKGVRVIVQVDRIPGFDQSNGDWADTRRYLITSDSDTNVMHSVRLDDQPLGEKNMGDWTTLRDFVEWGTQQFPADHYCLIIWDHGNGWIVRSLNLGVKVEYIATDDTDSGGIDIMDIPKALANVRMDVVAFDACLMQELEVAYEMRDSARYMVGSPTPEPSPGYNYSALLRSIGPATSPEDFCRAVVGEYARAYPPPYQGITQTAVDLSKIAPVADAASRLADVLIAQAPSHADALMSARTGALDVSTVASGAEHYSLDLLDYANRCASAVGSPATGIYTELSAALSGAIVAETHSSDVSNSHGMGVYVPPPLKFDMRYEAVALASATHWDEWLRRQHK